MTLIQLLVAFFVVGALLTIGAAFDVMTVLEDLAVWVAGVLMPAWDAAERLLR